MPALSPRALALVSLPAALAACSGRAPSATSASAIDPNDPVVSVTAHQWSYAPDTIPLTEGVAVTLDLVSLDVHHGFNLPDFGLRADILPGTHTQVRLVPDKKGTFPFFCDFYCGGGHENMTGSVVVQ